METKEKGVKPRTGVVQIEKRRYPRFSVDLPIEYYRTDLPTGQKGRALNASEGGLLIYFPEPMEIGQKIHLRLFFSLGTELERIEALVEVVWIDMHLDKDWGDYRCGVKFINLSPEDRDKLKNFLIGLSK